MVLIFLSETVRMRFIVGSRIGALGLAAAVTVTVSAAGAIAADQWIECKGDRALCRYTGHDRMRCPRIADIFRHVYVISGDMLKYYDNGAVKPFLEQSMKITDDTYTLAGPTTSVSINRKNGDFVRTDYVGRDEMMYRGICAPTEPREVSTQNRF